MPPFGVFFDEGTEQSHRRIHNEGLAECYDRKVIASLGMCWAVWALLSLCRCCSPFSPNFVCREKVWKEIRDVRLLA